MNYYNQIANSYNELYGWEQIKKMQIIVREIKAKKNAKVLDIGSGTGIALNYFPNTERIALDPSEELLKSNPYKSILGKAEHLPFPNHSFDVVLCITAIHHSENIKKSLQEIQRVLKPEGRFAVTLLKRIKTYQEIRTQIENILQPNAIIEEEKDTIFLQTKPS